MSAERIVSERAVVGLVGAVQFVNILDFMMVMPLGPDFATGLGISTADIALVGGAYTAAAAVSGLAAAPFLDRFDRRAALALAVIGLVVGTAAGALATGLWSLVAARVLAGAFGGPATSLAHAIIADVVPVERRGRAMGAVMGAFSAASVLGVPVGLELAAHGGWRLPFFAVAGTGLVLVPLAYALLPPLRGHLQGGGARPAVLPMLRRPVVVASVTMMFLAMGAAFAVIPNISAYLQMNLGFPRDQLSLLYMIGGTVSFFGMRVAGRVVDRFGILAVGGVATALLVLVTAAGFGMSPPLLPATATFVGFMLAMSARNVANQTLATRVPGPQERAAFMSLQNAITHFGSSAGAMASAQVLTATATGALVGMHVVAYGSAAMVVVVFALMVVVVRAVERRGR